MLSHHGVTVITAFFFLTMLSTVAHAGLQFLGVDNSQHPQPNPSNSVLTLHRNGHAQGSVSMNDHGDTVVSGDAVFDTSLTSLHTFAELGITSAEHLIVRFQPNEPSNKAGITLQNLIVTLWDPQGNALFRSSGFDPIALRDRRGADNESFVFGLDDAQVQQANTAAFGPFSEHNVVGLSAEVTDADGGPERFFVTRGFTTPVPEPRVYHMMLGGLLLMGALLQRRRSRSILA